MTDRPDVEDLLRELAPQVLGAVIRRFGDFDAAEDATQEALLAASLRWPAAGMPDNPRGWLIQTAVRQMTDQLRSDRARRRRELLVVRQETPSGATARPDDTAAAYEGDDTAAVYEGDDSLVLFFMCCHPALTSTSAIALTLRTVGGLTTAQIARAFLVPEPTMAQRISRAKQRIKASGEPFQMPGVDERAERLRSVLHVLYLMFNEGYTCSAGDELHRSELSNEAIRLTRMLRKQMPEHGEVTGLLALMLLTDARRSARAGPAGELIPLADQDRTRWDKDMIAEGVALVVEAMSRGAVGEYQLQAAIAAVHDEAARAEDTDWPQILALYGLLERMSGSPIVALNRAVAAAMVHGPATGLAMLDQLDDLLAGHYRLDAVRGHLLDQLGEAAAAAEHYRAAARRTTSLPERRYLTAQAARVAE